MDPAGYFIVTLTLKLLPWAGLAFFVWLASKSESQKWVKSQAKPFQHVIFGICIIAGVFVLGWLTNHTRLALKVLEPLENQHSAYIQRLQKELDKESEEAPTLFED